MSERQYVNEQEVARRTSLSRRTLRRFRKEGGGPPFAKVGSRVLYCWLDVDAWITGRASGAQSS